MPKKTFVPEQIVTKLRQIALLVSQRKTVSQACKEASITAQTFYRWRKEYGGFEDCSHAFSSAEGPYMPGIASPTDRRYILN